MVKVPIPDDIRRYKEKIMFGLTARQLIATVVTFLICVPLYWFGKSFIASDIVDWLIIGIAIPLVGIGFFRFNQMPMERFAVAVLKYEFLYPRKRKFASENTFKKLGATMSAKKTFWDTYKAKRINYQASLERSVLMAEAIERGDADFDVNPVPLLTVKTGGKEPNNENEPDKDNKDKSKDKSKKQKVMTKNLAVQDEVENIERQRNADPRYVLTKNESSVMRKWNQQQLNERKKELTQKKKTVSTKSNIMKKRRTAKTVIPRSTQLSIPYIADYDDGLFEIQPNKYSKMYELTDLNFLTGDIEYQANTIYRLGEFYNYFSEDMRIAIVIDNRFVSLEEQENKTLYPLTGDGYDRHREEYNGILKHQMMVGRNNMEVGKYVTVTLDADTPIEALLRFNKIDAEVISNLRKIGSGGRVLSTTERLAYYHDKFRKGREGDFQIDYGFIKKQGLSSKDYIAPTFFQFDKKHLRIEDDYYRVLFLNNLPASLIDEFMFDVCENDFATTASISIKPVSKDKGLRIVRRQLTGIEANKIDAEKRAIRAGFNPETIQRSIKVAHKQAEIWDDDLTNKDQKMFFVTLTFMIHGNSLEELNENCKIIEGKTRKYSAQMQTLTMQQEEGFRLTLPFGYTPEDVIVDRALPTESVAVFMPFWCQDLRHPGGFYYGLHAINRTLVMIDRTRMKTPSGFVLGSSGSGKSFTVKREILNVLLSSAQTSVLIIDPENEYGDFCRAFGGVVLKIGSSSDVYINPMDMPPDYGLDEDDGPDTPMLIKKEKAWKKKSEFIMSIVERMISVGSSADATKIEPTQKSVVDRAVKRCYEKYLANDFDLQYLPTLIDLQNELDKEKDQSEDGRTVAESVDYYTRGSMDIFAHKTNVAIDNRLIVFNVRDLGEQLRQIALIIIFDFIWNRMVDNKIKGLRTYCYCDEIHVMFASYFSAKYLRDLYKRGRKYGLCITGVTQNIEDLLNSEMARGMVGNSDFILMLNQHSNDLEILSAMLHIPETLQGHIKGSDEGCGLIFAENVIVPFNDRFPDDSYLYKLMSTKFGEMSEAERDSKIESIMATI